MLGPVRAVMWGGEWGRPLSSVSGTQHLGKGTPGKAVPHRLENVVWALLRGEAWDRTASSRDSAVSDHRPQICGIFQRLLRPEPAQLRDGSVPGHSGSRLLGREGGAPSSWEKSFEGARQQRKFRGERCPHRLRGACAWVGRGRCAPPGPLQETDPWWTWHWPGKRLRHTGPPSSDKGQERAFHGGSAAP